jgi:hypothetical protein
VSFVKGPGGGMIGNPTVRKTASFFELSLCLSRACLGKLIVYIYKWCKNAVFRRRSRRRRARLCELQVKFGLNLTVLALSTAVLLPTYLLRAAPRHTHTPIDSFERPALRSLAR